MKKCFVFTGGAPIFCGGFSAEYFDDSYVIAADSGCMQIQRLEESSIFISPDILLGDMDSFDKDTAVKKYPNATFLKFPPEKDYTDTQLAISVAVEKGYTDIEIIGGTGNRADHYLANLALLRKSANDGINLTINDGKNKIIYCKNGSISADNDGKFKYFSILPDSENLKGVYITGAKYPLSNATIDRDIPISVSNEITGKKCEINVGHGSFFFILCSD